MHMQKCMHTENMNIYIIRQEEAFTHTLAIYVWTYGIYIYIFTKLHTNLKSGFKHKNTCLNLIWKFIELVALV